jgi:hypothetical protein
VLDLLIGSLSWDTSQKFGIGGFAEIFSKNIVIPSKEIPFFGEAPKMVLGNYRQIWFLWCETRRFPVCYDT